MSLEVTGNRNFYYYGKSPDQTVDQTFPSGHVIWTQFPADIAKIRIGAILAATLFCVILTVRDPLLQKWCWRVAILGVSLAAYVAYKHLLTNDPLVEMFYKIAGGKENYEDLPKITIEKNQRTHSNFEMTWESLEHPIYQFTTSDGRKGMLIKGLKEDEIKPWVKPIKELMIFVEKLGPQDVSLLNSSERTVSILNALDCMVWNNSFSRVLSGSFGSHSSYTHVSHIRASISTDMANEFIAQRSAVNELKIEEV